MIYQELHYAPELAVTENLLLGHLPARRSALGRQFVDLVAPQVWTVADDAQFVAESQAMRRRVISLIPARDAYASAVAGGSSFVAALRTMAAAAEQGRDSTTDLVARVGRAARLGERSRGVLDAGATSCCLILQSIAASTERHLQAAG